MCVILQCPLSKLFSDSMWKYTTVLSVNNTFCKSAVESTCCKLASIFTDKLKYKQRIVVWDAHGVLHIKENVPTFYTDYVVGWGNLAITMFEAECIYVGHRHCQTNSLSFFIVKTFWNHGLLTCKDLWHTGWQWRANFSGAKGNTCHLKSSDESTSDIIYQVI